MAEDVKKSNLFQGLPARAFGAAVYEESPAWNLCADV